jgi:hypothetical protein
LRASEVHVSTNSCSSWFPSTQVTVRIDATFADDKRAGLRAGNDKWNNQTLIGCSAVRFTNYDDIFIFDYDITPPQGHLWWQNDDPLNGFNGGVFAVLDADNFVRAGRIKIHPNAPNIAQGTYFDYLGTHEVGHTFNLDNCTSFTGCNGTEDTIMKGHSDGITTPNSFNSSGPKACDIMKVRSIYCAAASPTPHQVIPIMVVVVAALTQRETRA